MTTTNQKNNKSAIHTGWLIVSLGALFYCYEYLLRIAPSAMIDELMQTFHLSANGLGIMIGLYYLAYTPMQAVVGVAHDLYGPKRILTSAVVLCVLGSLMFASTQNVTVAGVGRFLVGLGSSFAFVGVLKLAAVWLPPNRFAIAAGFTTALGMLAGMIGNIGMTYLVNGLGWKTTLIASTVLGIVLIPLMWGLIRDTSPSGISHVSFTRLGYKETFFHLAKIIKNPQIWICGFIGCVLYLSLSVFAELWGNKFVSEVYGYSTKEAALLNSMIFLGWLIGSPITGWISDRISLRRPLLIIGCFAASALSLLFLFPFAFLPHYTMFLIFWLFGMFCSTENICFAVGRENAHPSLAGSAVSYVNMLVMLGGMVFQPLVGKLLDLNWGGITHNGIRVYSAHNFKVALLILPIGLFIGGILSLILKETHAKALSVENADDKHASHIRWQCRRGMLELDALLLNYFDNHFKELPTEDRITFENMLRYSDQDLYDWILETSQPPSVEISEMIQVIKNLNNGYKTNFSSQWNNGVIA